MFEDLVGKVVIVTGASAGIGRAAAIQFAKLKSKVVLVGRNIAALNDVKAACMQEGAHENELLVLQCDVCKDEDLHKIVVQTVAQFGQINVLVNNAGVLQETSVETVDPLVYDAIMNTNVRAPMFLTKYALPHLIASKGNVVNVSSISDHGAMDFANCSVYCMSKGALSQYTRAAAVELAKKGVRVNAVCPAVIATDLFRDQSTAETEKFYEFVKTRHPIGRVGKPEDIAPSIALLASDSASSFTTGSLFYIDGGRISKN